jgi:hypothetical protein
MLDDLIVIGITGRARAGKDLCASFLVSLRGCHRLALADGIRSALADLGGPTGEVMKSLTPDHNYRRAMQLLGTEARLAAGADRLWVDLALAKIYYAAALHPAPIRRFAVPDVRYSLEVEAFRTTVAAWGGRFGLLKVVRTHVGPIAESDHSSETSVDRLDYDRAAMHDSDRHNLAHLACRFFDDIARRPIPEVREAADAV